MNTCKTCAHKKVDEINDLLAERILSFRDIAVQFNLGVMSLYRHYCVCLPRDLILSKKAEKIAKSDRLIDKLKDSELRLILRMLRSERRAEDIERLYLKELDPVTRATLRAELRAEDTIHTRLQSSVDRKVELYGKLAGQIKDGATVNVNIEMETAGILRILQKLYPDAHRYLALELKKQYDNSRN